MKILETVKNCKRIGITGHKNPDGDCAGACCGLALFLRKAMPGVQTDVYLEPLPEALFENIPGAETILNEIPAGTEQYDAFIILDSIPERTGFAEPLFESAALKVNIDHHKTNPGHGDVSYVDGNASSTCEMVYDVIDSEMVDRKIAQALYVGIVTDTGVFQYSNTRESTMRLAGNLISYGFDFTSVIREVFFERTYMQAKMLGISLARAERMMDGACLFCSLDNGTITRNGAARQDFEGVSAQMLLTEGVDCAVFIHETKPGEWRASMRSGNIVDVARSASLFGGGGHTRAAGCTIYAGTGTEFAEAAKILLTDIAAQLEADKDKDLKG